MHIIVIINLKCNLNSLGQITLDTIMGVINAEVLGININMEGNVFVKNVINMVMLRESDTEMETEESNVVDATVFKTHIRYN